MQHNSQKSNVTSAKNSGLAQPRKPNRDHVVYRTAKPHDMKKKVIFRNSI